MDQYDCSTCGACCAMGRESVGVTPFDEDSQVPKDMMDGFFMKTILGRCVALRGTVGKETRCAIYGNRPHICRVIQPGMVACRASRGLFKLGPPCFDYLEREPR